MSEIQRLEEENYDRHSEYRAVMIAEAFDPYQFSFECEVHDTVFIAPEVCPSCEPIDPSRQPDFTNSYADEEGAEDPLF